MWHRLLRRMGVVAAGAALANQCAQGPRPVRPGPSRHRSRRGRLAPLLSAGAVLLLVAFGMLLWLPAKLTCSSDERAVYGEFPQYRGLKVEPEGHLEVGSCAAYYRTLDSEEEVFAYFRERFEENGWEEAPSESYRMEDGRLVPTDLVAHRGDYSYRVSIGEIDPDAAPPGTHVAAHVLHRD